MRRTKRAAGATLALALLAPSPGLAMTLGFEDVGASLPIPNPLSGEPELFYSGFSAYAAEEPTDFTSGGASFHNEFTDYGGGCCGQGWFYSQTADTTTAGPANQYSAIAGGGAAGSDTYGVAFTGGAQGGQSGISRITLASEAPLAGAWFTNTTWAALSMQSGDSFAKPFGGATGHDPDFFVLTISGRDASDALTGSVDFALADYRFADDGLDYIVTEWTWVDLSGLGAVASLDFSLDSSDAAYGYLNTPSYFAMDDLVVVPEPGTGALLALGLGLLVRRRAGAPRGGGLAAG